jgi:hypothetical protein
MTPQFLREEASRFRGMADTVDREASKLRLLKMASDYEAKANAAAPMEINEPVEGNEPVEVPVEANEPVEPAAGETLKLKPARKAAREVKEIG